MKSIRCRLGWHKWQKRYVEDSQYMTCPRCGKEGNAPGRGKAIA